MGVTFVLLILILLGCVHDAEADLQNGVPSFSISGNRNPENGKFKFDASFRYNSTADKDFEKFFKTYSLADFTKLSEERKIAALSVILTFSEDGQEHDFLDSQTIALRQKEILNKYLDTADSKTQSDVYRQATFNAIFYDTAKSRELYFLYSKANPETSKSHLCGVMSSATETYVGMNEALDLKKLSERATQLQNILNDQPNLGSQTCFENSTTTLKDYLIALQTNTPIVKGVSNQDAKKYKYEAPMLKDCNKKNIQILISTTVDSLIDAPSGTIGYLGSKMKHCKLEGRILKIQGKLFFNSDYHGKSGHNIPLQDLLDSWGIKLSNMTPIERLPSAPVTKPANAKRQCHFCEVGKK